MTTRDRDERISLAGADPEEVLRALLTVDPEEPEEPGEEHDGTVRSGGDSDHSE
jgi:hypothetical protein